MTSRRRVRRVTGATVLWLLTAGIAAAQPPANQQREIGQGSQLPLPVAPPAGEDPAHWNLSAQLESIRSALVSLPLAAALGAALAFRPRRRGTPARSAPVIQTQIILAVVGAVVMLVVGASLARAFGIVGAASLIRYRAKIADPKDAGVMLSTLSVGLAAGVGLYALAIFGTLFFLAVLWGIESLEPERRRVFTLKIAAERPHDLQPALERYFRRQSVEFDLRTSSEQEICYEVRLPLARRTDRISDAILHLGSGNTTGVEWEEQKDKN